jgi:hypothetical protein
MGAASPLADQNRDSDSEDEAVQLLRPKRPIGGDPTWRQGGAVSGLYDPRDIHG